MTSVTRHVTTPADDSCPPTAFWRDFLAHPNRERDIGWIDAHLDTCQACRGTLEKLSTDDWLSPLLQEQLSRNTTSTVTPAAPLMQVTGHQPAIQIPGLRLLGIIGEGGMGLVYMAIDEATEAQVACKIMARVKPTTEERSRFRREAAAVASLDHPNIVKLLRSGEVDGTPYFVMEYAANGTLEQRLRAQALPPREAARFFAIVARAMAHAHERGVVHRDLKPGNILLGGNRQPLINRAGPQAVTEYWLDLPPKIVDFGLAKVGGDTTQWTRAGQLIGTPAYAAPEQLAVDFLGPADTRSDVYSLGAILYQMLTGVPPLQADDVLRTIQLVRDVDPTPPRRLQPGVPRDLETICLHCLEKTPNARYRTAAELADDLDRFLGRLPIVARRPTLPTRLARWSRRNPWKAAAYLLATAVVGGLIATPTATAIHYRQVGRLQRQAAAASEMSRELAEKNLFGARIAQVRRSMAEGDDIDALPYLAALMETPQPSPHVRMRLDCVLRELPRPALRVLLPMGDKPLPLLGPPLQSARLVPSPDGKKLRVQVHQADRSWEVDTHTAEVTRFDHARGPLTEDLQWRLEPGDGGNGWQLAPLDKSTAAVPLEAPPLAPLRWLHVRRAENGLSVAALAQMRPVDQSVNSNPPTASPQANTPPNAPPNAQANAQANAPPDAQANAQANEETTDKTTRETTDKGRPEATVPQEDRTWPYRWYLWRLPKGQLLRADGYPVRSDTAEVELDYDPWAIMTPHELRYIAPHSGQVVFTIDSRERMAMDVAPSRQIAMTTNGVQIQIFTISPSSTATINTEAQEIPLLSSVRLSRHYPSLALGSFGGRVKLIDLMQNRRNKLTTLPHRGTVQEMRFDRARPLLLVVDNLGHVAVIDVASANTAVPWIPHRRPILAVNWLPTGDFAVLDHAGLLTIWKWSDGWASPANATSGPDSSNSASDFNGDPARRSVQAGQPSAANAPDSTTLATVFGGPLLKQFSADGQRLLIAQAGFAEVWDTQARCVRQRHELPTPRQFMAVTDAENGFALIVGEQTAPAPRSETTVTTTSNLPIAAAGQPPPNNHKTTNGQTTANGQPSNVDQTSRPGQSPATVPAPVMPSEPFQVVILDTSDSKPRTIAFQLYRNQPAVIAADRERKRWLLGTTAGLELWKADGSGRLALIPVERPAAAAWAPSGREIAVLGADGRLGIWDPVSVKEIIGWPAGGVSSAWTEIGARIVYSPDGSRVFVYGRQGLRGWSRTSGHRLTLPSPVGQWINHMVFDKSGRRVSVVHGFAFAQIWDTGDNTTDTLWKPLSGELRATGLISETQFSTVPDQLLVRSASIATVARQEIYRVPIVPGNEWAEREQLQIWDWSLGEKLSSLHSFRDYSVDWLAHDGGEQFVGLSNNGKLRWPRIAPPTTPSREALQLLVRQYLHAAQEADSPQVLEPEELVREWRRLRELEGP